MTYCRAGKQECDFFRRGHNIERAKMQRNLQKNLHLHA